MSPNTSHQYAHLLTPAGVAELLGVTPGQIEEWLHCPTVAAHVQHLNGETYLRPAVLFELRHYYPSRVELAAMLALSA